MSPQSEYARPLGSQSRNGQSLALLDDSLPELLDDSLPELLDDSLPELLDDSLPELLDDSLPELLDDSLPELLEETIGSGKLELELAHWSHCSAPRNGP